MQVKETSQHGMREEYQRQTLAIRGAFLAGVSGAETIAARARLLDNLIRDLWANAVKETPLLGSGIALVAIGGYGRRELFPHSDVDLLYLLEGKPSEDEVKQPIRAVSQALWDCGIKLSPMTRKHGEVEKFDADNVEFALSLLDHRFLTGDAAVYERWAGTGLPRMLQASAAAISTGLVDLTTERHKKYGETLFHLEPSIKDCPGGLRDVHVCAWLTSLSQVVSGKKGENTDRGSRLPGLDGDEFQKAMEFLFTVRCFLHYRHERDDNTLDWQAQDAAASERVGLEPRFVSSGQHGDAAYWMRIYFRHARVVERRLARMLENVPPKQRARWKPTFFRGRRRHESAPVGYRLENGRAVLNEPSATTGDPAQDPELVLRLFAEMSRSGCGLDRVSEERICQALPVLSAHLEEGPALWKHLQAIFVGHYAGMTLRVMHAMGILELLIPEFHGIDALVIRDAYHRYTVDEHTMVLIDTLHGLEEPQTGQMAEWAARFGGILRDVQHQPLLYLGALLHDTGKGRSTDDHARESARMAESVLRRLELDAYESELLLGLIRNHLEMSAALRRDIFDVETVRTFAGKVQTPEALRMLTLFTYADIQAVHPDALTPWKAENLWRLFLATASFLDRSVDDERVGARIGKDLVRRVAALAPGRHEQVQAFLEGLPERYLRTHTPEDVRRHFEMAQRFSDDKVQLDFRYAAEISEITLVTPDRALLFSDMAGVLAAWGMNIVTADAFSNQQGIVVDSFRFTDTFRTLEMNASEHDTFVASVHDVMAGKAPVEKLLAGRRRRRRDAPKIVVETRIDFDDEASSHSTLLQVVAQDMPGLLRAISLTLGDRGCNIEVALVDTEGETAIDVFYVTRNGVKLDPEEQRGLQTDLLQAIEKNAA